MMPATLRIGARPRRVMIVAAAAMVVLPSVGAVAQRPGARRPRPAAQEDRRIPQPRLTDTADTAPRAGAGAQTPRAVLDRRVQQTIARLVRERVGLDDAQMRQLAPVNRRFEAERRAILRGERDVRQALRRAMLDSASADDRMVQGQLDSLLALERQRVDLVAREQRALAAFMSPIQRARYLALQEQVRRRLEQMRRQRGAGGGQLDSVR